VSGAYSSELQKPVLTDSEAASYIHERVELTAESSERRPLERSWFLSKQYYAGRQHVAWDARGFLRRRRTPPNRERYVANKILPKVYKSVAKLLQVNADFRVAPSSDMREDLHAAKVGNLLFNHLRQTTNLKKITQRVLEEAAICGAGFFKVTWNPDKGVARRRYFRDAKLKEVDIRPEWDDTLRQEKEQNWLFEDQYPGEIEVESQSPFKTWWDPHCTTDVEDALWMATVGMMPRQRVRSMYGDEVADAVAEDIGVRGAHHYEDVIAFSATDPQGGSSYNHWGDVPGGHRHNRTLAIDFYEVPLRQNNWMGRHITWIGGVVVENGPNPGVVRGMPLPFVKVNWFDYPGRFIGLSLVEQLRWPQRARNRARAHMMEFQKTNGYGMVFLSKNAGLKPRQIVSLPTPIIEYNAASPPPIVTQPPNLPPYIAGNADAADIEMNEIAAQTEPSKNALPAGVRSGIAIKTLQAENNAVLAPTAENLLRAIVEVGTHMLQLAGQNYTEARMIQTIGPGNEYDVRTIRGADLRGNYRLQLISQPGVLETAEAKEATVLEAVQLGILDPKDPDVQPLLWRVLNFGTSQEVVNMFTQQTVAEEREIERMTTIPDYMPEPKPWNLPIPRLRVLEKFLNSHAFEVLNPLQQQKIAQRWQAFVQIRSQQLEQQMQAQMMMSGGAQPKGEPSQPKMTA